ncbi:MAG: cytidine deaminase [Pseudomonadota bacterium]
MNLAPEIKKLIEEAWKVREHAYTPYFRFPVGAAVLTKDGRIFAGCNVENAAPTATVCAEGTAIGNAISSGKLKFKAIAVVGPEKDFVFPCGTCRQRLFEFNPKMDVYMAKRNGDVKHVTIEQLLPNPFKL